MKPKEKPEPATKKQNSKFIKGVSGNPAGRTPGSKNKATMAALVLLRGEAVALTRVAINAALGGDLTALKICMERLIPAAKDMPTDCVLPKVETITDLPKITSGLLDAVSSGNMGPSEAEKIVKIVSGHVQALQLSEFENRLTELETAAGLKKGGGK
jgi:hypothetical protein